MSDVMLFVVGCMVTLTAASGFMMFAYSRFRSEYSRQNQLAIQRNGKQGPLSHLTAAEVPTRSGPGA